jgi:putative NADPH-quinone reductase
MGQRILILDGHPDPAPERFVHALANAYREGAQSGGHEVLLVRVADVGFSLLRSQADYQKGEPPEGVRRVQANFDWASHVVILYPLWLGGMPAMLKGLLEQMLRPGFAFSTRKLGRWPVKLQGGKSARVVVTMGMPAAIYRFWYRAHSLRSLQRNILKFVGFRRVRASVIGGVEVMSDGKRKERLQALRELGREAK